jgi:2-dehydropantoate 2-reductase
LISKSDISCEITSEIDKYLWAKMLYNCALNPLGAILDKTYGQLTENPYTLEIMDGIIDEIFDVINASPYETLWQSSEEYKDLFYSKLIPDTYNHYSSTHQDIQRRIPTEIDSMNGKVIQLGEANNINVSTNKLIYNLIKAIESTF